jgi:hypothetical protein
MAPMHLVGALSCNWPWLGRMYPSAQKRRHGANVGNAAILRAPLQTPSSIKASRNERTEIPIWHPVWYLSSSCLHLDGLHLTKSTALIKSANILAGAGADASHLHWGHRPNLLSTSSPTAPRNPPSPRVAKRWQGGKGGGCPPPCWCPHQRADCWPHG